MTSFEKYIANQRNSRRTPRTARHQVHEDASDVSVTRSPGLDAATVALPAGITLDDRAARMNNFWKALVEFQHRDVLVVALCAGEER